MTANPDAEILRAEVEVMRLRDEINADLHSPDGAVSDEATERECALESVVADTPAKSLEGVAAKLRLAAHWIATEGEPQLEGRCALSALEAVERLSGATSSTVAPETTGEDPFEALAKEWAEQKAECERLAKAEEESGATGPDFPSDAATDRLGEIETRIAETPTTTILGIVTKLRAEVYVEVDYDFTTTENVIKTVLEAAEHLLAQSRKAA